MDLLEAHQRAQDAFARVLSGVTDDQLDAPTPCAEWQVRDLVGHVVAGNERTATGSPAHSPAHSPAVEDVAQLVALHATSAKAAQDSFSAPGGLTRTFEFPFGTLPAHRVIGMRATDALTHTWDLARATGQPTSDLDEELAAELLAGSRGRVRPEFRGPGMPFADEQPCDPDAPASDRLAAFLGRAQH
ncbi:MAG TPA: TIGR03086 family metal-binding protein [Acidimicrobiales bacterium]|nr:TIGR03086 family metal-binding protein [Acidimicrobiales bacterium]